MVILLIKKANDNSVWKHLYTVTVQYNFGNLLSLFWSKSTSEWIDKLQDKSLKSVISTLNNVACLQPIFTKQTFSYYILTFHNTSE